MKVGKPSLAGLAGVVARVPPAKPALRASVWGGVLGASGREGRSGRGGGHPPTRPPTHREQHRVDGGVVVAPAHLFVPQRGPAHAQLHHAVPLARRVEHAVEAHRDPPLRGELKGWGVGGMGGVCGRAGGGGGVQCETGSTGAGACGRGGQRVAARSHAPNPPVHPSHCLTCSPFPRHRSSPPPVMCAICEAQGGCTVGATCGAR